MVFAASYLDVSGFPPEFSCKQNSRPTQNPWLHVTTVGACKQSSQRLQSKPLDHWYLPNLEQMQNQDTAACIKLKVQLIF
jgi:hypothetical protein